MKRMQKQVAPTKGIKTADWSVQVLKRTWALWKNCWAYYWTRKTRNKHIVQPARYPQRRV